MKSFDELLKDRLAAPVRSKQGEVLHTENGEVMTAQDAMVMSIVNNAMKGDIAAISIVRNLTRESAGKDDATQQTEREKLMQTFFDSLKSQLQNEKAYDGQDEEIRLLAETRYLVDVITRQIQAPDFQPVIVEYGKDGTTKSKPNPLVEMHDQQEAKFKAALDKVRQEAIERIKKNYFKI